MSADTHDRLEIVEAYWAQLRAVDDRLLRRARLRSQRRRLGRTLAFAVLALLAAAATALAAKVLLFGHDAPPRLPSLVESFGEIDAGSSRLLSVRESDADGGPPWGLRLFRAGDGRNVCLQAGRVVDGELVALGVAGAFGNDGKAHRLPVEVASCNVTVVGDHVGRMIVPQKLTRSAFVATDALASAQACVTPDQRRSLELGPAAAGAALRDARESGDATAIAKAQRYADAADRRLAAAPEVCPDAELRAVLLGFAGSNARAVEFNGVEHPVLEDEDGAFMFVLRGDVELGADPLTIEYPDGTRCPMDVGPTGQRPAGLSAACVRLLAR